MNSPLPSRPRKRRRPALACEECRRRKIKCDRNSPCGQCVRANTELCNYIVDEHTAAARQRQLAANQPITPSPSVTCSDGSKGDEPVGAQKPLAFFPVLKARRPVIGSMATGEGPGPSSESAPGGSSSSNTPASEESTIHALTDRVQQLEKQLVDIYQSKGPYVNVTPQAVMPRKGIFNKTRLFGASHWMNSAHQFESTSALQWIIESDESSEMYARLGQCKKIGRTLKSRTQHYQAIPPDFRSYVPPRAISDKLVALYLRNFESTYRVVHVPTFHREYEEYLQNPEAASTSFIMRLLLIMAIGSCFYQEEMAAGVRLSSPTWINTVQSYLNAPGEKKRLTIPDLQTYCLLILARQASHIAGDLVWIAAGSLLRIAMHMGLHRDPTRLPKISIFQAQMRKRLWATILEITVQSSMDSGGPPMISCHDYDCEAPANLDDDELYEDMKSLPPTKALDIYTQTSCQIMLLRSFPIRLEIVRGINDFRSDSSYDETLRLGKQINDVYRLDTQAFKSYSDKALSDSRPEPLEFHKLLFELMTQRFLFTLHFPFAIIAKSNPIYYYSRKVSLETSLALLSRVKLDDLGADGLGADDFTRLMVFGKGLYSGVHLHCSSTLCWELLSQLEDELTSFNSLSKPVAEWELYRLLRKWGDLISLRLKAGETNIKGMIFFSAIIGEVDAIDSHLPTENEMINRIRKSLEVCFELLTNRLNETEVPLFAGTGYGLGTELATEQAWNRWDPTNDAVNINFDVAESWLFPNWLPINSLEWPEVMET